MGSLILKTNIKHMNNGFANQDSIRQNFLFFSWSTGSSVNDLNRKSIVYGPYVPISVSSFFCLFLSTCKHNMYSWQLFVDSLSMTGGNWFYKSAKIIISNLFIYEKIFFENSLHLPQKNRLFQRLITGQPVEKEKNRKFWSPQIYLATQCQ